MRIVSGQVFLGAIVGERGYAGLIAFQGFGYLAMVVFVLGSIVVAWALAKGPPELGLFVFFANLILAAALVVPNVTQQPELRQWHLLTLPGVSGRYWLFPMLDFVYVLL